MPKLKIRHYGNSKSFSHIEVGEVFRVDSLGATGVLMKVTMGQHLMERGEAMGSQWHLAVELATGTMRRIDSDTQCVPLNAMVQIDETSQ